METNFLNGKVAMVTGGSRGIGREVVRLLSGAGASVHFCGRSVDSVQAAERDLGGPRPGGGKVTGWPVDVTEQQSVRNWFAEVAGREGRLDVLVNNASGFSPPCGTWGKKRGGRRLRRI